MKFSIQAVDRDGSEVSLIAETDSEEAAALLAREKGYFPTSIRELQELPQASDSNSSNGHKSDQSKDAISNTTDCHICGKLVSRTLTECPHCGEEVIHDPAIYLGTLLVFIAIVIGLPVLWVWSNLSSQEKLRDRRTYSNQDTIDAITSTPTWANSILEATGENQRLLESYHRQGKFLGYTDGNELVRDIKELKKAEEILLRQGY